MGILMLGEPLQVRSKEPEGTPAQVFDVVRADVNGRRINVYFPQESGQVLIADAIVDRVIAVYNKEGPFDLVPKKSYKINVCTREMTPTQAAENNLQLRAYQILNEGYLSLFSRAATAKLSHTLKSVKTGLSWTTGTLRNGVSLATGTVKNGALWAAGTASSAYRSSKNFYSNHPVVFKRAFLTTACAIAGIASYYIQLTYNPVGRFLSSSDS